MWRAFDDCRRRKFEPKRYKGRAEEGTVRTEQSEISSGPTTTLANFFSSLITASFTQTSPTTTITMHSKTFISLVVSLVAAVQLVAAGPVEKRQSVGENGNEVYYGQATWFEVGVGACGGTNTDSEWVVALNQDQYTSGSWCWYTIVIENTNTGKTATAAIVDECPGCGYGSLDMSPSLFTYLSDDGSTDEGVFPIAWSLE